MFKDLETWLSEITGFAATSLQPNAGSAGEYAGLLVIRAFEFNYRNLVAGQIRPPKEKERFFALLKVEAVDGEDPDKAKEKGFFAKHGLDALIAVGGLVAFYALGDRAFCAGVNQFVFHTFAHQPYRVTGPGFTFALWGLNFNRANTWWEPGRAWMEYLTRCNHLLREGKSVADVLWFVGEDVPNRIAWRDELKPVLPRGYDFDGCDAKALMGARARSRVNKKSSR